MAEPLIIVINDDIPLMDLIKALLTEAGYWAVVHTPAAELHALVRQDQPALVILNVEFTAPQPGWRLLERLALDPATRAVPVLVCSAERTFLREKTPRLHALSYEVLERGPGEAVRPGGAAGQGAGR
jgi:CheY-like chemotaxis protein